MRIVVFTESYEPVVNGVSVSVATLRDALRERGHDVIVFAPEFPGHEDAEGVFRFPSVTSRYAEGYPIAIPISPKLKESFLAFRPDIVHTQTPFFLGVVGMHWARKARVPIVSTNHTMYTEYVHYLPFVPRPVTTAVLVRHMRRYYGQCSAVVVPSKPVEDVLRSYGIDTRMEIIKSGVTTKRVGKRGETRRAFGIPNDAFLLLYVGRIAREKNLGLLLESFKEVQKKNPEIRLMIVGSGPYEQASHDLADSLGVRENVIFAGMLSREDVERVYSAADVFVFPSVTETQGIVLCEALTAGLPCVAVRAAGTPEVLEDGVDSLLTDNSVESFSKSVCRVVSDANLRTMLSQGALRNAEMFTTDAMAEHFERFYRSEIDKKRGKRDWSISSSTLLG
jgi:glycosyltransferase involved in cell wall biosynthesis